MNNINIREVKLTDTLAICDIYNYYVANTTVTFETAPVAQEEMQKRITEVTAAALPYLVTEVDGEVAGYCYIHKWNNRCAYSSTKEITVYVGKDYAGKGIGSALYGEILKKVNREDTHVLIAGIALPNEASVTLNEKFGFMKASHLKEVGWKFDKWIDVGYWQLIFK